MALGFSLMIVAIGAVLRYGYTPSDSHGFNWAVTGGILMIIGIVGGIASIIAWVSRSYSHRHTSSVTEANGQVVRRDNVDSTQTLGS